MIFAFARVNTRIIAGDEKSSNGDLPTIQGSGASPSGLAR
jgi:hypothetical protein